MKMIRIFLHAVFVLSLALSAQAELRVANIFGDNMVLQRDTKVAVWGWDEPGRNITVSALDKTAQARAGKDGKWMTHIGPFSVGDPFVLRVSGSTEKSFKNVVAGEVWICSGQSNMEWPMVRSKNSREEQAAATYPMIRHVNISLSIHATPKDDTENTGWEVCSPASVGSFTGVGYYFARHLYRTLHVPIGLLSTSVGGSAIEPWISAKSLREHPDFDEFFARLDVFNADPAPVNKKYGLDYVAWKKAWASFFNDQKPWHVAELNDADWETMLLPGKFQERGLRNFDGMIWFRKKVRIPPAWIGKDLELFLGHIDDDDVTWVNGTKVGATKGWKSARNYQVPGQLVTASEITIAVQVYDPQWQGGFHGYKELLFLTLPGEKSISLAGGWKYCISKTMAEFPPPPKVPGIKSHNSPTALYNAMVNPLVPYTMRGAIWYQGEANVERANQYQTLFPLLIKDWREKWQKEFPFYFVQLANFMEISPLPQESDWAELREAQSMTLSVPRTGQAVIIDIGETKNIHPGNKQDVGKRLALHALANDYGKDVVCSGPLYKSMQVEEGCIRLFFDHIADGLKSRDGKALSYFALAGADRKFVWADARIDGNTVVVSHRDIPNPVAVRYAWADNPEGCNLVNSAGLPASAFRTDGTR